MTGFVGIGTTTPENRSVVYSSDTSENVVLRVRADVAREASFVLDRGGLNASRWELCNEGNAYDATAKKFVFKVGQ